MNLQKIKDQISKYKKTVQDPDYDGWQLWKIANHFRQNWNLDTGDFYKMYENSFSGYHELWHREHHHPKEAILRYIEINEEMVRAMFKDLLNEKKNIVDRINRFIFQCDGFYKIESKSNLKTLSHDHDNKEMIFAYLCFAFPDRYTLYNFSNFKSFMELIGSAKEFQAHETERFIKANKTLSFMIQKDSELIELIEDKIGHLVNVADYPMIAVSELYSNQ